MVHLLCTELGMIVWQLNIFIDHQCLVVQENRLNEITGMGFKQEIDLENIDTAHIHYYQILTYIS